MRMILKVDHDVAVTRALACQSQRLVEVVKGNRHYARVREDRANSQAFDVVSEPVCVLILEMNRQLQGRPQG